MVRYIALKKSKYHTKRHRRPMQAMPGGKLLFIMQYVRWVFIICMDINFVQTIKQPFEP